MNEFQSTMWTLIHGARAGDEEALRDFVLRYRAPIVAWCRRKGHDADAEDFAQEVLIRLIQGGVLLRADPALGRFRSLVLGVTQNVVAAHVERETAQKRGAGRVRQLGDEDVASPEPDEDFDRGWVAHLLEVALARLARDHPNYHEALRLAFLEGVPHAKVARRLGRSEGDVKNHVFRGKAKLVEYVREQVREYSTTQGEYEEELRALSRFLPDA